MEKIFSYNKEEKLKSRNEIDQIFSSRNAFLIHPLKVFYLFSKLDSTTTINCGVSVSKKHFVKAVDRNRIKRLLREAYRTNKIPLHDNITQKKISIFVLYIDKKMPEHYIQIESKMKLVIEKLNNLYHEEMAK